MAAVHPQEFPSITTLSEAPKIYSVKCGTRAAFPDIEAATMMNGRSPARSVCVKCGTTKFSIGVLF